MSVILAICTTIYFITGRSIFKPLSELRQSAESIASGNFDAHINTSLAGEIGQLAEVFDMMMKNIKKITASRDELESEIKERKKAEKALVDEKEMARLYIDIAAVIIIVINADQTVALINKKGCSLLGYEESEILGKNWFDNFIPESNREKIRAAFTELISKDVASFEYFENLVLSKDKTERLVAWRNAVIRNDTGMVSTLSSGEDITERKQAEIKLRAYSENLEAMVAERTKMLEEIQAELLVKERLAVLGHFAGSISHELRNPLAAIDSAAYLLKMRLGNSDEKLEGPLEIISSNVKQSTDIIQSLLNLSRMEKPNTKKTDLVHLVTETLGRSGIPDTVEVVPDMSDEPVFVDIEIGQIRMALKNIIKNAVQAMNEKGKLAISTRFSKTGFVEIRLADIGMGILPEHLEKVFEPLFSTKTHGIGFGLSITKMIIENHGGTIRAESPPENGAIFIIALPFASAE